MVRCGSCGEENPLRARFCLACAAPLAGAEGGRESRRIVTVLFADMVGSTTLGERLDAEAFRALQARYFAALRGAIERHGGTVEKYIGDAVMAVFGLPTLHEDDALRAVRAAADLAPALELLNGELDARHGIRLELRIGVHTGEVVAADAADRQAMVAGDTVNTAARLEAAARPGEILLGPLTFELVRDAIAAEALDDLALRGRDEPLKAYRLLAITGTEAHVRRLDTPLVGRLAELATLRTAFDRAVKGPGCELVTVLATAGTGKSRLVREFLASTADRATILCGRCLNYGDGITYWALGEILRAAAGVEETDDPAAVRAKLDALVAAVRDAPRVAGILASVLGVAPEPASADDIAWAVRRTLTLLATERPLVVVVEDIHWAEPALLDLLEAIIDWSQGAPILLLCPARPELLEARPDWGAGRPNAAALLLEPLDPTLASDLIDVLPGGTVLPGAVRERILSSAEGNPLFVEEFLAMLVDDGQLRPGADGAWMSAPTIEEVPVPRSISLLLAARLDSLDPADRHVAERASVVGRVFERGAVVELSPEAERGTLGGRLLSLTRRHMIRPDAPGLDGDDAFRFRHVLIRDAAYEALTKAERADLHERFARWLERVVGERLPEYVEILAYHLAQAVEYRMELGTLSGATGERIAMDAFRATIQAAERSEQLHAYREALNHHQAALRLLDLDVAVSSERQRVEVLSRASQAAGLAGDVAGAVDLGEQAVDLARKEDDALTMARLQASLATQLWDDGDDRGAMESITEAARILPDDAPPEQRAVVLADIGRLSAIAGQHQAAVEYCERAIALTSHELAPRARARALITIGSILGQTGHLDAAIPIFAEAKEVAEAAGDGTELARYYHNLAGSLAENGRAAEARSLRVEGIDVLASYGLARSTGVTLALALAAAQCWGGEPEAARQLITRIFDQGVPSRDVVWAQALLGQTEMLLGNHAAAEEAFARGREVAKRKARDDTLADLAWSEADNAAWCGRTIEARVSVREAILLQTRSRYDARVMAIVLAVRIEADAAERARAANDSASEAIAREAARAYAANALELVSAAPAAGATWGLVGDAEAAMCGPELARAEHRSRPEAWSAAATRVHAFGIPGLEAYALWRWAEALVQSGASSSVIGAAVREGIHVSTGTHEPARRELVALAKQQGFDLDEPAA